MVRNPASSTRERNGGIDTALAQILRRVHPGVEVLTAVTRGGVHETGAGIVGNMVAGKHRHSEVIAAAEALERMRKRKSFKFLPLDTSAKRLYVELGLGDGFFRQRVGKDQLFTGPGTEVVLSRGDLVETVVYRAGEIIHGPVAGDRPRRCRPDDDMGAFQIGGWATGNFTQMVSLS